MYPRHRLDLGLGDLGFGLLATLGVRDPEPYARALLDRAGVTGLVTLSVRSAWDLLLTALAWPPGSEVVVSAITHPDMVTILGAHGLRAVPVDVDPDTLAPDLDELVRVITARTRAVMVVELFGGRVDLAPVSELAHRNGLLLVVDAAQAFVGPEALDRAHGDVRLYSFGLIKTASAVGGALLITRDTRLLAVLDHDHRRWPRQRRHEYAGQLLRALALLVLSQPWVYGRFFALCHRCGVDPDRLISSSTRSFAGPSDDDQLLARLRRRPSPALVAVLAHRLRRFNPERLRARRALGERVAAALPAPVRALGPGLQCRTHWLFPVAVDEPHRLVAELRRVGLDASPSTSNLTAVGVAGSPAPDRASALIDSVVYLPVYPELPVAAVNALLGAVDRYARSSVPSRPERVG